MDLDEMMDSLDNEIATQFEITGPRQRPGALHPQAPSPRPVPQKTVPTVVDSDPEMVEVFVTPSIRISDREYCGHVVVNGHIAAQLRHMMLLSEQHKRSVVAGGETPTIHLGHIQ